MRKIYEYIKFHLCRFFRVKGYGISILVPLHLDGSCKRREENWDWLKRYWEKNLPGAEIIIGHDKDAGEIPFSKSVAVNDAAIRAHGDILVIVDADVYISVESVLHCAKEIRTATKRGNKLWFMPYRHLFRLTEQVSNKVIASDPLHPYAVSFPPAEWEFSNKAFFQDIPASRVGHWYGAMIQIMSKSAFYEVGGWDPRFRGWGGEDHAAMVAMDTLYGPHKTIPSQVLHLWHPVLTVDGPNGKKRLWSNQRGNNDVLSGRYYYSLGNYKRMRKLIDEFLHMIEVLEFNQPPVPPQSSS